jgi:hypothetical protein
MQNIGALILMMTEQKDVALGQKNQKIPPAVHYYAFIPTIFAFGEPIIIILSAILQKY